jgi:hypothetical protein
VTFISFLYCQSCIRSKPEVLSVIAAARQITESTTEITVERVFGKNILHRLGLRYTGVAGLGVVGDSELSRWPLEEEGRLLQGLPQEAQSATPPDSVGELRGKRKTSGREDTAHTDVRSVKTAGQSRTAGYTVSGPVGSGCATERAAQDGGTADNCSLSLALQHSCSTPCV